MTSRVRAPATLAALLAMTAGVFAYAPAAHAYDDDAYTRCQAATGQGAYCCNQAGGVWRSGSCGSAAQSPAPTYMPPNNGFFIP